MDMGEGVYQYAKPGTRFKAHMDGHSIQVEQVAVPVIPAAKFGVKMDGRDNTDKLRKCHDEVVSQGGGWVEMSAGLTLKQCDQYHPSVSWKGAGRSLTRVKTAPNQAALADDFFGAREQALFYILARARSTETVENYYPEFRDFSIDGDKAHQTQTINNITFEGDDHDPDRATWGDKAYASGRIINMEIHDANGHGISIGAGRHRGYVENARATLNAGYGYSCLANDNIIGPRSGFGSNGLHQVRFAGCSGALISGANIWSGYSNRSDNCLAVLLFNVNGGGISNSVLNDTLAIIGSGSNSDRPIVVSGNVMSPDNDLFSADGVPLGTASANRNAHVFVDNYKAALIAANNFSRAAQSPNRTFGYMLSAVDSAKVLWHQIMSTETGMRAYATAALRNDGTAQVLDLITDVYAKIGQRGGAFGYGWDPANGMLAEVLDAALVSANAQLMAGPMVYYDSYGGYEGVSTRVITMTNGGSTTVASNRRVLILGANVGGYTINLPARLDGFMARELTFVFTGTVGALTWNPGSGDTIASTMPGASTGTTLVPQVIRMVYVPSTRQWLRLS